MAKVELSPRALLQELLSRLSAREFLEIVRNGGGGATDFDHSSFFNESDRDLDMMNTKVTSSSTVLGMPAADISKHDTTTKLDGAYITSTGTGAYTSVTVTAQTVKAAGDANAKKVVVTHNADPGFSIRHVSVLVKGTYSSTLKADVRFVEVTSAGYARIKDYPSQGFMNA